MLCSSCKEDKPETAFNRDSKRGRQRYCIPCSRERTFVTVELEVGSAGALNLHDLTRALEDVDVHETEPGVGLRTYATVERATVKKAEVRMRGGRVA